MGVSTNLGQEAPPNRENSMKIGYLFPVAIIITAIVLLAWFIIGGYAMPG